MEPFQLTNIVIALLVYPKNLKNRERLERELNQAVTTEIATDEDEKECSSLEVPQLATPFDPLPLRARNRLDNRLKVARMFRPFVRRKIEGALPALPLGLKRYSINALSRYVSQDDKDAAQNFDRRWLKPTLPVLHLAIAFDLISTLRFGASQKICFSVHDEEFIDSVLHTSIWLEPFVLDNSIQRGGQTHTCTS